jgi:hypothetical protein
MKLAFFSTKSCAINEIHNLQAYLGKPEEAMKEFCRQNVERRVMFNNDPHDLGMAGAIYAFYLFSARVMPGETVTYGDQFAAYILEHELGKVWESEVKQNEAYHPNWGNRVWVWTPDLKAIHAWWGKRRGN